MLIIIHISLQPIFGQIFPKNGCNDTFFVNAYNNRFWPNLSKSNISYEYATSSDSLFIIIVSEKLTLTTRDATNVSATSTSWTTIKKQSICIPIEIHNNINFVILLIGDCSDVGEYCKYFFVKNRKDDLFKLKYLNKNAKRVKSVLLRKQ